MAYTRRVYDMRETCGLIRPGEVRDLRGRTGDILTSVTKQNCSALTR